VVCLHGLTGNAHNFDGLARTLVPAHRALALDVRGRGESAWAPPDTYTLPEYVADLEEWLDGLGIERATFVGTSMGGLITMMLAARAPTRVSRAVLNDIGPTVDPSGLERIRSYVGNAPEVFPDLDAVVGFFRSSYPGQRLTDAQVKEWAGFATRPLAQGGLGWRYDPAIRKQMSTARPETTAPDLWVPFEAMRCPVLVVHGGASDVLSSRTVEEMLARGAECAAVEVDGVGHAPALTEPEALGAIREFLAPLRAPGGR
jgi:pimeloyl-ACP methyl ester carboxylesterase